MISHQSIKILVLNVDNPNDLVAIVNKDPLTKDVSYDKKPFIQLNPRDKIILLIKRAEEFACYLTHHHPHAKGVVICRENSICDGRNALDPTLYGEDRDPDENYLAFLKEKSEELVKKHPNILFVPGTIALEKKVSHNELKKINLRYHKDDHQYIYKKELSYFSRPDQKDDQLFRINKEKINRAIKDELEFVPFISNVLYAYHQGSQPEFKYGKFINGADDYRIIPGILHEVPSEEESSPLLWWNNILMGFDICKTADVGFCYIKHKVNQSQQKQKPLIQFIVSHRFSNFSVMPGAIHAEYGAIHIDCHQPVIVLSQNEVRYPIETYYEDVGKEINARLKPINAIYPLHFQLLDKIKQEQKLEKNSAYIRELIYLKNEIANTLDFAYVYSTEEDREYLRTIVASCRISNALAKDLVHMINASKEKTDQSIYKNIMEGALPNVQSKQIKLSNKNKRDFKEDKQAKISSDKVQEPLCKIPKIEEDVKKHSELMMRDPLSFLQCFNHKKAEKNKGQIILTLYQKIFVRMQEANLFTLEALLFLGDYFGIYIKTIYDGNRREMKLLAAMFYSLAKRMYPASIKPTNMLARLKGGIKDSIIIFEKELSQWNAAIPHSDFKQTIQDALLKAEQIMKKSNLNIEKLQDDIEHHFKKVFNKKAANSFFPSASSGQNDYVLNVVQLQNRNNH